MRAKGPIVYDPQSEVRSRVLKIVSVGSNVNSRLRFSSTSTILNKQRGTYALFRITPNMQITARRGRPYPELAANKGSIGDESQSSRAGISNPAYVQPLGCTITVRPYADPVIPIRLPIRIHN